MTSPRLILGLLYLAAVAQLAWTVPQLPPVIATHYDSAGVPNGWMSRESALVFHLAMLGVTAFTFVGLPGLLGMISPRFLNLPNKEHWLAPERRAASIQALRNQLAAMGCGVVLLLMVVTALNFQANQSPPAQLSAVAVLACLGGFLVFVIGWTIAFHRRFGRSAVQRT